jgi:hypothetical protein
MTSRLRAVAPVTGGFWIELESSMIAEFIDPKGKTVHGHFHRRRENQRCPTTARGIAMPGESALAALQ